MKILITALNNSLDASMDPRFGRASWFAVKDLDSDEIEFIDNDKNLNAMQGAGVQSGQKAVDLGVNAVITGHVGPKAFQVLNAANIKIYQVSKCSVKDAITQFTAGSMTMLNSADKDGHW